MPSRRAFLSRVAAAAVILAAMASPLPKAVAAEDGKVVVFAAASLKTALDAVNTAWTAADGKGATISYAASSALAKQIEAAAPADVFLSADRDWMSYLDERKLVRAGSVTELLGNSIVLVAPKDSAVTATIAPGFPLKDLLGDGRLAMADTASVPAGKYGKAALTKLGVWDTISGSLAQAENVRAALALVSRGEAPLGIVYATDAAADPSVKVVATFPDDTHPPIVYPGAVIETSTNADAQGFLTFLHSDAATAIFRAQGFTILPAKP